MVNYGILRDASFWGPGLWRYLHCLSLTSTDFESVSKFLRLLIETLPCEACKIHSTSFMNEWAGSHGPLLVNSRDELARFVNELHNSASHYAGKVIPFITLDESKDMVLKSYKDFHVTNIMRNDYVLWLLVLIVGAILFFILFKMSEFWKTYRKI